MKLLSLAVLFLLSGVVLAADPKLVVWDGDDHAGGGGWGQGDNKPKIVDNEGHSGKTSVCFPAAGAQWIGWGWNWHGWWPQDAGDDITGFTTLSFWAKVTGDTKPTVMQVTLTSNGGKHSKTLDAMTYQPKLMSGEWVEVRIPIKDLLGDKPELDLTKVFELDLGEWSNDAVKFSLFVDDIAFEKDAAKPTTAEK